MCKQNPKKEVDMAAPKGNQFAKGHGCGRPPDTSDKELVELGKEMVEWFMDNPDAIFIQEFAIHKNLPVTKLFHWNDQREIFRSYYERARAICGVRQVKGAGKEHGLQHGIAQRFMTTYFTDVKRTEKELAQRDEVEKQPIIVQVRGVDASVAS